VDQRVGELWDEYRGVVRALYEGRGEGFLFDPEAVTESDLATLADLSDNLTRTIGDRIPSASVESAEGEADFDSDLETVAVAAAAIDVAVAADVLEALKGEVEELSQGVTVPPLVEMAVPVRSERDSVQVLLDEADGLFPEGTVMRGSALWPASPDGKALKAIDHLVESGTPLATNCGVGLLSLGVTSLIGSVGGFEALKTIARSVGRRAGFALRLVASGVAKIRALVGAERLVEAAVDFSAHQGLDALATLSRIDVWVVSRLVRRQTSVDHVGEILESHVPNAALLETRLEDLCDGYSRNMKWGKRYAKFLKIAAPGVVLLGLGPPGVAAVAAGNGIGLTYGLFSLSDRLDTTPFVSWVDGVPTMVRQS
jgi:hypothetical protein